MSHPTPIDITTIPELARIAEEVAATKTPRELKQDNKTVAVIMPVEKKGAPSHKPDQEAIEETLALVGAWGERDWNEVEQELDHIRHHSKPTPPLKL